MDHIFIPEAVSHFPRLVAEDVSIVLYSQNENTVRNRVVFNCNAISFVLSGKKEIYRGSDRVEVKAGEATLIPEGHSLIAERSFDHDVYSSLVIFFPSHRAVNFLEGQQHIQREFHDEEQGLKFRQSAYMKVFVQNLFQLITQKLTVSSSLVHLKLEEAFLLLMQECPDYFFSLFQKNRQHKDISLMMLVEHHLMEHLTLEELAFLAHKSLSSFKRDFERSYGISPGRFIRERKLELASKELSIGKSPSELYLDYGYESLSNFIQAFKKQFGYTPSAYRNMSVAD